MGSGKLPLWVIIRASFRADARKTAALAVLAVVAAVVYARLFWKSGGPSEADAQISVAVVPAVGAGTAASTTPVATERITLTEPVPRELKKDPFAVDPRIFPPGQGKTKEGAASATASPGRSVDDGIREDARQLVLQSTLCGRLPSTASPAACISGQVLSPGQQIDGFVLKRVEPTHVVLERDGVRIALFLK